MKTGTDLIHATAISFKGFGFILRGKSGAGKSDLALRIAFDGGRLIADDQVCLNVKRQQLYASCPAPLKNMLEVRGIGLANIPTTKEHLIHAVIDLKESAEITRLPQENNSANICGIDLPLYEIDPLTISAVAKIDLVAQMLVRRPLSAANVA